VGWRCQRCGEEHEGLPLDWAFVAPAYWDGPQSDDDLLTDDLCVWTDDRGEQAHFIRGVLPIPVRDTGEVFGYGVWSSLSERSFARVRELWDDERRVDEPPYFGWLSNGIPGYPDTRGLQVAVITRALDLRPSFVLLPSDDGHPLVDEQWQGITSDRVREIAELYLHPG
jgi:hypothetical protein